MKMSSLTHLTPRPLLALLFAALVFPACADDSTQTGDPPTAKETPKTEPATPTEAEPFDPLKVGIDVYYGLSDIQDFRKYNDHLWAGYGAFVPSTVYASYENERGYGAKLSIGTGALFNTKGDEFYQPAEAWVKAPVGKSASVTLGKFWVPIGIQEWDYESKPGAMLEYNRGDWGFSAAATENQTTKRGNFYSRLSHSWGEKATIGLSLCGGRGVTFASDHDRGIGLDGQFTRRNWQFSTELLRFKAHSTGRFDFAWIRAAYNGWGKWKPFVSRYTWNDQLGQQGTFRSTVLGLVRQINKNIAVETTYARVDGDDKYWAEVHYSWEK